MDITKVNVKPFDGTSFSLWKWQVETYLKAAGLEHVIHDEEEDGQARVPTDEEQNKFNLILSQTMTREQLVHVVALETGKEKWQRLNEIHESSSADLVQSLYNEFFSLTPDEDTDIATYVSRLTSIKVQLSQQQQVLSDELIVGNILQKLPVKYSTFVVSWQATAKEDRTFANLTNRLLREEARLSDGKRDQNAFAAAGKRRQGPQATANRPRYPSNIRCYACNRPGHKAYQCRYRPPGKQSLSDNSRDKKQSQEGSMAFNIHSARSGNETWIMDSGATCHICPHRSWFTDFVETSENMFVADGRVMEVKGKGNIVVWTETSDGRVKVLIQDVRFVPEARCCLF